MYAMNARRCVGVLCVVSATGVQWSSWHPWHGPSKVVNLESRQQWETGLTWHGNIMKHQHHRKFSWTHRETLYSYSNATACYSEVLEVRRRQINSSIAVISTICICLEEVLVVSEGCCQAAASDTSFDTYSCCLHTLHIRCDSTSILNWSKFIVWTIIIQNHPQSMSMREARSHQCDHLNGGQPLEGSCMGPATTSSNAMAGAHDKPAAEIQHILWNLVPSSLV